MKFEVLSWIWSTILNLLGKFLEVAFRIILLIVPMGLFLALIQLRGKVSSVSNITVYTNENSVWQFIFPGFMLVSIDRNQFKNLVKAQKDKIQSWISSNKYILVTLFCALLICLIVKGI